MSPARSSSNGTLDNLRKTAKRWLKALRAGAAWFLISFEKAFVSRVNRRIDISPVTGGQPTG